MIEKYEYFIATILVILLLLVAFLTHFNGPVIVGTGVIMMIIQAIIVKDRKNRQ